MAGTAARIPPIRSADVSPAFGSGRAEESNPGPRAGGAIDLVAAASRLGRRRRRGPPLPCVFPLVEDRRQLLFALPFAHGERCHSAVSNGASDQQLAGHPPVSL